MKTYIKVIVILTFIISATAYMYTQTIAPKMAKKRRLEGLNISLVKKEPNTTGGQTEMLSDNEDLVFQETGELMQLLPFKGKNFVITYSYKLGKFIVTSQSGTDPTSEFLLWLKESSWKHIPIKRFMFVQ